MDDNTLYEKDIFENEAKGHLIKLVLSKFMDVEYLHLRKYYQDFEGEWHPTKEGVAIPASIPSIYALLDGLIEICSLLGIHRRNIRIFLR